MRYRRSILVEYPWPPISVSVCFSKATNPAVATYNPADPLSVSYIAVPANVRTYIWLSGLLISVVAVAHFSLELLRFPISYSSVSVPSFFSRKRTQHSFCHIRTGFSAMMATLSAVLFQLKLLNVGIFLQVLRLCRLFVVRSIQCLRVFFMSLFCYYILPLDQMSPTRQIRSH
jgi:hypothetical protein